MVLCQNLSWYLFQPCLDMKFTSTTFMKMCFYHFSTLLILKLLPKFHLIVSSNLNTKCIIWKTSTATSNAFRRVLTIMFRGYDYYVFPSAECILRFSLKKLHLQDLARYTINIRLVATDGLLRSIRNGKIVWKFGSYCWYFRLNLKYMGWPYRAYIKTAKNGGFCEELLSENNFQFLMTRFTTNTSFSLEIWLE